MTRSYKQLDISSVSGFTFCASRDFRRKIAEDLSRSPSTISREVYRFAQAQRKARQRGLPPKMTRPWRASLACNGVPIRYRDGSSLMLVSVSAEWIYRHVDNPCLPGVTELYRRVGDWEADTIVGAGHRGALVSVVDSKLEEKGISAKSLVVLGCFSSSFLNHSTASYNLGGSRFSKNGKVGEELALALLFPISMK